MPENLWPDFDIAGAPRSPKAVIQEAGDGLSVKTRGLIKFTAMPMLIKDDKVTVRFNLFVRDLTYSYPFLTVSFAVNPVYPVSLVADKVPELSVANEEELIAALTRIFNAPPTIETVQRLMSLARQ